MTLQELITRMRNQFDGFNPPASESDLSRLQGVVGRLPDEVLQLYRDHNGSTALLRRDKTWLAARLMPVEEVFKTNLALSNFSKELPAAGAVTWLWTDDNSNYLGVYSDGPLSGCFICLDHEEPLLAPAYRSLASFLTRLIGSAPGIAPEKEKACSLVMVPREIPVKVDGPAYIEHDRKLTAIFRSRYQSEQNEDLRRFYAMCAICLTPVADTGDVLSFLADRDMWTPEAAVCLLEVRDYKGGTEKLEKLAREGHTNGDSAAMRQLVRLDTNESKRVLTHLKKVLKGHKLSSLEMWMNRRNQLQSPRWP